MSKMQNWLRWCAVTTLCVTAQAQDAAPAPAETTASGSMGMAGEAVDYSLLNNRFYDFLDLRLAQELGYSDGEIASIAKIARLTGLPFKMILDQVHQGRTFALLASEYNLKLADVLDASDERARIDQYLELYQSLNALGMEHTEDIATAQSISGPTLAELETRYNQLNAAFPPLPPTDIETTPFASSRADTTTPVQAVSPVVAAPPPPTPPAPSEASAPPVDSAARMTTRYRPRHHLRHRRHAKRRHRHHAVSYPVRMGS